MSKLTYGSIKEKLFKKFNDVSAYDSLFLSTCGLDKKEIIEDLATFMVFFDEFEKKQKNNKVSKADLRKQFVIINNYLDELNKLLK